MKYVIGVDSGGTKTESIAYDEQGNVLQISLGGFGNIYVDREQALKNICTTIEDIMDRLKEHSCVGIYLGIGGVEGGQVKEDIDKYFSVKYNCICDSMNDSKIALLALLSGQDGLLLVSGTGSICYALHNNENCFTGGWGSLLGDEGSGYHIGISVIRSLLEAKDLRKEFSSFNKAAMKFYKIDNEDSIIDRAYSMNKPEIASVVPLVVEASNAGDNEARELLTKAGQELAYVVKKAYRKLGFEGIVNLGIKGSVVCKIQLIKDVLIDELNAEKIYVNLIDEDVSAAKGAYFKAINDGLF